MNLTTSNYSVEITYKETGNETIHNETSNQNVEKEEITTMTSGVVTAFQAVALVISAYILISLVTFELRRGKSCVKALAKKLVNFTGGRRYMASGKLLRYLCISGAVFCTLSSLNDLIYYNLSYNTDVGCTIMQIVGISYMIGLDTVVYIFLWIRQYVTCRRFLLRNKTLFMMLSFVKWSVLVLILLLAAVMDCLLIIFRRHYYDNNTQTCEQQWSPADEPITHLWTAGSVSLQIILVFMFAFPLLHQYSNKTQTVNGTPTTKPKIALPSNRVRIMALVQRCVIIASLCVVTDVATMLVTEKIFTGSSNRQLRALLYNFNIIFNLIMIIRSFKDWKSMIFLGYFWRRNRSLPTSHDVAQLT